MKFNLIQIASIVALIQAIIIGLYLLNIGKKASKNTILLALLVFTYSILILCSLVLSSGIKHNLFLLAHIFNQCAFLVGPLVYFYVKIQLHPGFTFRKQHLFHLLPFVSVVTYLAIKLYFVPMPITCRSNHIFVGSLAFVHMLCYFIASHQQLKKNGMVSKKLLFSIGKNPTAWLLLFVYGCSLIWLTKLLFFIVWDISGNYQGCNEMINLHFLTIFLLFNTFLYFLLIKPQIFTPTEKYKHSILSNTAKQDYLNIVLSYMDNEKAYRNSLLTLKSMSKKLSIGERYLSQIINESFNENFYGFINRYRIKESEEIIKSLNGTPKTILSIAYEVGFNSKSTFNSAFKKYTDYTPKEYRELHKKNLVL